MKSPNLEGRNVRPNASAGAARAYTSKHQPPASHQMLLNEKQAAALLNVSARFFHDLRSADWMPAAIVLGPRALRWSRVELEAAVLNMPRAGGVLAEPPQLLARRVHRIYEPNADAPRKEHTDAAAHAGAMSALMRKQTQIGSGE